MFTISPISIHTSMPMPIGRQGLLIEEQRQHIVGAVEQPMDQREPNHVVIEGENARLGNKGVMM